MRSYPNRLNDAIELTTHITTNEERHTEKEEAAISPIETGQAIVSLKCLLQIWQTVSGIKHSNKHIFYRQNYKT